MALGASTLLLFPGVAWANTGTPLMWAGFLHLSIGNAMIGLVEGVLVAWIVRAKVLRSVLLMIGANYFSTIVGLLVLPGLHAGLRAAIGGPPIQTVGALLILLLAACWVFSILLEWPFVWFARERAHRRWGVSLGASAIVQTLSYGALVPYYLSAGSLSLLTETTLVDRAEFESPLTGFDVYAIAPDRDIPIRIALDDAACEAHALKSSFKGDRARVFIDVTSDPARVMFGNSSEPDLSDELLTLGPDGSQLWHPDWSGVHEVPVRALDVNRPFWQWIELRPDLERRWYPIDGFWPIEGLTLRRWDSGEDFAYLALATPFEAWPISSSNALPGDLVVFEAEGQILALHVPTMRIAFLAYGRSPVVVRRSNAP